MPWNPWWFYLLVSNGWIHLPILHHRASRNITHIYTHFEWISIFICFLKWKLNWRLFRNCHSHHWWRTNEFCGVANIIWSHYSFFVINLSHFTSEIYFTHTWWSLVCLSSNSLRCEQTLISAPNDRVIWKHVNMSRRILNY